MNLTSNWMARVGWLVLALVGCDTDQRLGTIHSTSATSLGGEAGATEGVVATGGQIGTGGTATGGMASGGTQASAGGVQSLGGQNSAGGATAVPNQVLCDGSTDIRLALTNGGGMVDVSYDFVHPYGYSFLFIDGQCRYWISQESGELREGVLAAADALDVEERVAYDRLAELEGDDSSCPDAGSATIRGPSHEASCSCGCDTDAKQVVFDGLSALEAELWNRAQAQDWSLSAARTDYLMTVGTASVWPLSWPVTDLPLLEYSGGVSSSGMPITDANDRAKLRALRAEVNQRQPGTEVIRLTTDPEPALGVVLHEHLPAETRERVARFLAPRN